MSARRSSAVYCAFGLAALIGAFGCTSSSSEGAYACAKVPDLIEAGIGCVSTASCPCGTSCVFGRCEHQCMTDADCDGSTCTVFGQCGGAGQSFAPLQAGDDNYVQVAPDRVGFRPDTEEVPIVLRVGRPQVEAEVRVSSNADRFVVACPGEQDFRPTCVVTLGPDRPTAVVRVRRLEGDPGDELERFIRVQTAHRLRSLPIDIDAEEPVVDPLRPGTFEGYVQLAGIESSEAGRTDLAAPLRLPVTVILGPAEARGHAIAVDDPLGFFGPATNSTPIVVGLLSTRTDNGALTFESVGPTAYLQAAHPRFTAVDLLSEMTSVHSYGRTGQGLTFELEQTIYGGPSRLRLRWAFVLDETGAEPRSVERAPVSSRPDEAAQAQMVAHEWTAEASFADRMGLGTIADPYARLQTAICARDEQPTLRFGGKLATGVEKTDTTNREFVFLDGEVACARANGEGLPDEDRALERWPVFPILQARTAAEEYEAAMVECLTELEASTAVVSPVCHDVDRWLTAAALGLTSARQISPQLPPAEDDEIRAQRVAAYLVYRHLDVAGYLEQVFANQTSFRAMIDLGDPAPAGTPSLTRFVELMTQARAPLLHPRLLYPLSRLHPRVLSQPDYRFYHAALATLDEWSLSEDMHATPLLVGLLEDGAQRMQNLTRLAGGLGRGELVGAAGALGRVALQNALRQVLVLYVLGQDMRARLAANLPDGANVFWLEQADAAERILQRRLTELLDALTPDTRTIDDLALPWFRVGDQTATGARFRAMVDYFLGSGSALGGVVGDELSRAASHEAAAVSRYQRYRAEAFRLRQLEIGVDVRRDDLAIKVGSKIIELCGYDRDQFQAKGAFAALQSEPNPNTCYFDTSPSCAPNQRRPSTPEAGLKICRAGYLIGRVGRGSFPGLGAFDLLPNRFANNIASDAIRVFQDADGAWAVEFDWRSNPLVATMTDLDGYFTFVQSQGQPASLWADVELECNPVYERLRTALPSEDCDIDPQVASQAGASEGACASATFQRGLGEVDPSCFRGQLGNAVLAIRSAELAVTEAEAEFGRLVTDVEVAIENCNILESKLEDVEAIYDRFIERMEDLRQARRIAQQVSAAASATSNCLSATQKGFGSADKISAILGSGLVVGICAAEATIAAAESVIADLEEDIENAEDELDRDLDVLDAEVELRQCRNNLASVFAKLGPAGIRIREAVSRYSSASTRFRDLQGQLIRLYDEGKQWEANLDRRSLMALPQEFDFLERFQVVEDGVDRVQRALIYASQALQYELQQSILSRAEIQQTTDLLALDGLARQLRDAAQSGVVQNGGAATSARLVVSLKEDILTIPEPGEQPEGWHRLPSEAAFTQILTSPGRRVYAASGEETGIGIRFTFSPDGLANGATGLAERLGGRLCAERVWSVGAVVVGADAVPIDGSVVSRMFLRKRNGFQSRRCGGSDEPVVGFIDPNSLVFSQDQSVPNAQDRYTSALLNSPVWRGDFAAGARVAIERGTQAVQLSQEHAGWGLYGDYELFIPKEAIGPDKLRLENVRDIMLVFDLVVVSDSI